MRLSPEELALRLGVPNENIAGLVNETSALTASIALRLARFFGTSSDFWMELQARYELAEVRAEIGEAIAVIQPFSAAGSQST